MLSMTLLYQKNLKKEALGTAKTQRDVFFFDVRCPVKAWSKAL